MREFNYGFFGCGQTFIFCDGHGGQDGLFGFGIGVDEHGFLVSMEVLNNIQPIGEGMCGSQMVCNVWKLYVYEF